MEGELFNIQRFSTGDGPGIRTTFFFKGCPLRCKWCHNPESQSVARQISYYHQKCIMCGTCVKACPNKLLSLTEGGVTLNRNQCIGCGQCAKVCPVNAIECFGNSYTIDELLNIARRDRHYYKENGGVTLSGGEPMLQWNFVMELLRELKREGIHTALDTSGYTDTFAFTQVLPYVDMLLYDIKHMDPIKHREGTGVDNQKILDHFRLAQDKKKQTLVRVPVIPGYNDTEENWTALAELLHSYPNTQIELLGYHAYGQPKYEALGMVYKLADLKAPSDKEMAIHKAFLRNYGVNCME